MEFLILGLCVFFAIHILPSLSYKQTLIGNVGEVPYKIGFSLVSLSGLVLIIYGFSQSGMTILWQAPSWGRSVLFALMPVVCILWVVAELPNNIKKFVRHPMLIGMTLWGFGHLLANGDLRSTLIFASFAIFSILNIIVVNGRAEYKAPDGVSKLWDVGVILAGFLVYGVLFYFHGTITGMPLR